MSGELGCGAYRATIAPRGQGGTGTVGEEEIAFTSLDWDRRVDEVASATAEAAGYGFAECCATLGDTEPWRDELVIYRDGALVWVGPVTTVVVAPDAETFRVEAAGLSVWWSRRRFHERHRDRNRELADIAQDYHDDALSVDASMNVTFTPTATGITATRTVRVRERRIVSDAMRELMDTGLDVVDYGPLREIRAGGLEVPATSLPLLTEEDFRVLPTLTRDGEEEGTRWTVTGFGTGPEGADILGTADDTTVEGTYGVHERVESESEIEDQDSADAAAATRLARTRTPETTMSDGVLADTAPFQINELVAGQQADLRLRDATYCVTTPSAVRVGDVRVSATPETEDVTIELMPLGTT